MLDWVLGGLFLALLVFIAIFLFERFGRPNRDAVQHGVQGGIVASLLGHDTGDAGNSGGNGGGGD